MRFLNCCVRARLNLFKLVFIIVCFVMFVSLDITNNYAKSSAFVDGFWKMIYE